MNHNMRKFEQVSKDYAIHVLGEIEHNYLVQQVLTMKLSTFRNFVNSMGERKSLQFVPMSEEVSYFVDEWQEVRG